MTCSTGYCSKPSPSLTPQTTVAGRALAKSYGGRLDSRGRPTGSQATVGGMGNFGDFTGTEVSGAGKVARNPFLPAGDAHGGPDHHDEPGKPCCAACAAKGPGVSCANGACGVKPVADTSAQVQGVSSPIFMGSNSASSTAPAASPIEIRSTEMGVPVAPSSLTAPSAGLVISSPPALLPAGAMEPWNCRDWLRMPYANQRAVLIASQPALANNRLALDNAQRQMVRLCESQRMRVRPSGDAASDAAAAKAELARQMDASAGEGGGMSSEDTSRLVTGISHDATLVLLAIINGEYGAHAQELARQGRIAEATTSAQQSGEANASTTAQLDALRAENERLKADPTNTATTPPSTGFFKPWMGYTAGGVALVGIAGAVAWKMTGKKKK